MTCPEGYEAENNKCEELPFTYVGHIYTISSNTIKVINELKDVNVNLTNSTTNHT